MTIKVMMLPHLYHFRSEESGIKRVVEAYFKYLPQFDIELTLPDATNYDLRAVHAGMSGADCDVAHLHGLYWSGDLDCAAWEYEANKRIVEAIRNAKQVTVPSSWVAETFQRDMRFTPHIIGHGIEWDEWQHSEPSGGYVLWNKNRYSDVCKPDALDNLSLRFPDVQFISTFGYKRPNTTIFNTVINHQEMKGLVQRAGVYLSSTKETFGIGVLEAMAAGVPVLGWRHGGNVDLVQHGVNGYLAAPGDYDDLADGLVYCLKHRAVLGTNGREMAKAYTWQAACEKVAGVYRLAIQEEPASAAVVIPVYNKTIEQVSRAINSALSQTYRPSEIIVVNDGSQDNGEIARLVEAEYAGLVEYIYQDNQGVANARNNGIALAHSKYIVCLDGDDWLEPGFVEAAVREAEKDRSLGIAYTGLKWHDHTNGAVGISDWPPDWNYDNQLKKQNQIPTCCLFRREMWQRLGGYRQRYAPGGAGAEDGEFWLRAGAYGWAAKKVTDEPLFNYSLGGSVSGNKDYREPDWLSWHPWVKDNRHPFASYATPHRMSHPVRQYDEPLISVIIPVGPGHEKEVINALDSLEAQTFRKWEAVVIWDFDPYKDNATDSVQIAYPYAKFLSHGCADPYGAGWSRNLGVKVARAPLILFLDADDTLHPQALERMLEAWNRHGEGVYTDYVGQAFITDDLAGQLEGEGRLQSYNPKDGEAIISYQASDFDCARALRQPEADKPYIWNLITTLIPKIWHDQIGGFDEQMETWEDWDYWLRMVRAGHCFRRLPRELVRYRFYTGKRRNEATPDTETGRQKANIMLQYITRKYEGQRDMGCGCGNKKNGNGPVATMAQVEVSTVSDGDFVKAIYAGPRGNHHVRGAYAFNYDPGLPSKKVDNKFYLYYGYIANGRQVLVHREDVRLMVGKWMPIQEIAEIPKAERVEMAEPVLMVAAPEVLNAMKEVRPTAFNDKPQEVRNSAAFDLQTLPGVNAVIARKLKRAALDTPTRIKAAGVDGLTEIEGITNTRANTILAAINKM